MHASSVHAYLAFATIVSEFVIGINIAMRHPNPMHSTCHSTRNDRRIGGRKTWRPPWQQSRPGNKDTEAAQRRATTDTDVHASNRIRSGSGVDFFFRVRGGAATHCFKKEHDPRNEYPHAPHPLAEYCGSPRLPLPHARSPASFSARRRRPRPRSRSRI